PSSNLMHPREGGGAIPPSRGVRSGLGAKVDSTAPLVESTPWGKQLRRALADSPILGPLLTLLAVYALCAIFVPNFLTLRSLSGIISAATLTGMVAIGVTLLMIAGEFDLSVGALVAVGGYLYAFNTIDGGSPGLAVALAVLVPAALGALNGFILILTRIPSFIVTLGTRSIFRGLLWVLSTGVLVQTLEDLPVYAVFNGRLDALNQFAPGANFRSALLWLVGLVALTHWVLVRTQYGNHVFAVGGRSGAAVAQGVNVRRVKLITFAVAGALAGFTGVLLFSQFKSVRVTSGAGMELSAIAAAVVGGGLLSGGSGSIWGSLVGVLLISTLRTGVVLLDLPFIPADNFEAVVGATIVGATILNNWLRRRG
ncbi:MAG TPA: ABC transporter permease, partial [Anaerolineales bacterium]